MRSIGPWLALVAVALLALGAWLFVDGERAGAASPQAARPQSREQPAADSAGVASAVVARAADAEGADAEREATEEGAPEVAQRAAYSGSTRVTGTVVSAADGHAIEGAQVLAAPSDKGPSAPLDSLEWAKRKNLHESHTDDDGRFALARVPAGTLRLAVRADGFAPLDLEHLAVSAESEHDLGELRIELGVRMAGSVLDAGGAPVAGASLIRVADARQLSRARSPFDCGPVVAVSGADGSFRIACQAVGPWTLLAHADEFLDVAESGTLAPAGASQQGVILRLARASSIDGVVRIGPGPGAPPIESVGVSARRASNSDAPVLGAQFLGEAQCEGDGRFHLGGLVEGESYTLTARVQFGEGDKRREIGASVDALAGDEPVELVIQSARVLVVDAVDPSTGARVRELDGRLFVDSGDGRGSLTTDSTRLADGRTRFVVLDTYDPSATLGVELSARGYRTLRMARLSVEPGKETELGPLRMDPLAVARVRVIDARTGQPLRGARVAAELTSGDDGSVVSTNSRKGPPRPTRISSEKTGSDGIAELYASSSAIALASAAHDDYARSELFTLTFGTAGAAPLDIGLEHGGRIEVQVLDARGDAWPGARVFANWQPPDPQAPGVSVSVTKLTQISDGAGTCVFESLPSGRFLVRLDQELMGTPAKSPAPSGNTATVDVTVGTTSFATLRAAPRLRVWGRVTEAGAPLAGATLTLAAVSDADREWRSPSGWFPNATARTDDSGRYEVRDLGPGTWTIAVEHPSRIVPFYVPLDLTSADVERDIVLSRSAMLGRVVDGEGNGIEGARVVLGLVKGDRDAEFVPLLEGRAAVLTDAAGNFELRGPPAGRRLSLQASLRGYQTVRSSPRAIGPDETVAGIELVMRRGARIEVRVTSQLGDPARAPITARRVVDAPGKPGVNDARSAWTNGRGVAVLEGIAPGRWLVGAYRPREDPRQAPTREVEVDAGATAHVDLELRP